MAGDAAAASAIARARTAFLTNTTTSSHAARNAFLGSPPLSSPRWKLRQLYGLCEMLAAHAEKLVQSLSEQYSLSAELYYRELDLVLEDIARHYANITRRSTEGKGTYRTWGTVKQRDLPVGVSLLLFDTPNPIRFLFGSLASNVTLGNTVVLANLSSNKSSPFWRILREILSDYLDSEAAIVLETFELDPSLLDSVDLVSVFAERSDRFPHIAGRSNTQIISTKATSIVVVDEGSKSYEQVTSKILESFAFRRLRPESTQAVFIRDSEFPSFHKAFSAVATDVSPGPGSVKVLSGLEGFSRLSPAVYWAPLSTMLGRTKKVAINTTLDIADGAGVLLVISYRSIDQVIEALDVLGNPPKYLTLLAPLTKENSDYFEKWTHSQFFSLDCIRSAYPYGPNLDVLFPTSIFGKTRVSLFGSQGESQRSFEAVLKHVQRTIKKPSLAPNQTAEFFGYVARMALGAGLFIAGASATGVYMWYRKRVR